MAVSSSSILRASSRMRALRMPISCQGYARSMRRRGLMADAIDRPARFTAVGRLDLSNRRPRRDVCRTWKRPPTHPAESRGPPGRPERRRHADGGRAAHHEPLDGVPHLPFVGDVDVHGFRGQLRLIEQPGRRSGPGDGLNHDGRIIQLFSSLACEARTAPLFGTIPAANAHKRSPPSGKHRTRSAVLPPPERLRRTACNFGTSLGTSGKVPKFRFRPASAVFEPFGQIDTPNIRPELWLFRRNGLRGKSWIIGIRPVLRLQR